jgi:hypothetical protein
MRFEKVIWTLLAMWLIGGGVIWNAAPETNTGNTGEYQAADGGSTIPPPPK